MNVLDFISTRMEKTASRRLSRILESTAKKRARGSQVPSGLEHTGMTALKKQNRRISSGLIKENPSLKNSYPNLRGAALAKKLMEDAQNIYKGKRMGKASSLIKKK